MRTRIAKAGRCGKRPSSCVAALREQVVEYEVLLNQFFRGVRAMGMCLFDRRRLPPALLDHAIATHSSAAFVDHHVKNPFYEPLQARIAEPDRVAFKIGELRRLV